jgi:sugar phosphate isomerase/epimerase
MTQGWMEGDDATNAWFRPLATYAERFDAMIQEIARLGFTAVDIWLAHLHWSWATDEHVAVAQAVLVRHGMAVSSLAGGFGGTRAEVERSCQLAAALGAPILGGNTALLAEDRAGLAALLRAYGLRFGYENHPEKSAAELLAKIGGADEAATADVIGVCVDTGWFGTHRVDAVAALRAVAPRLVYVHLKDVLAAGGHETCRYGTGCVPIQACVRALLELGYAGSISIEHEPELYNPNDDCRASLALVQGWLAAAST